MSAAAGQSGSNEVNRLQRWFQAVVTHADGVEAGANSAEAQRWIQLRPRQIEKVITRSRALTAAERLAIYANAYHTRLLECLAEVFPMLKRTLGEEAFDGLAFGYLQQYPSRSYTLNELGRHFPRYLQQTRPAAEPPEPAPANAGAASDAASLPQDWPDFLIDLALLEWGIYEVFDGPGLEGQAPLGSDQLLDVPAEFWPEVRLEMAPCVQLLATRFPVNDYFTALRGATNGEPVPIPPSGPSYVALNRRQFIVRRYNLSRAEFELLRSIKEGRSIGEAIESAVLGADEDQDRLAASVQLWFCNWTAEGFFRGLRLAGKSI